MECIDLDIVFLGGLFPKESENDIFNNSLGSIDNAANNLQWKLVRGLDANLICPVTVINSLYIGSYPKKYKKPFIRSYTFSHANTASDINVGFINIMGVKHISRLLSIRPHLTQWATNGSKKQKVVIAYALTSIFVYQLCYIKKLNPDIITVVVVPDLPANMNTTNHTSLLYNIYKALSIRHINSNINNIDGFALLTKDMATALKLFNRKTVIVEGIAEKSMARSVDNITKNNDINIVYTGTLNERYGVVNLVKAFMKINDDRFRLVICGLGDSEQTISEASLVDKRIIYKGQLRPDEIIKVQNSATILVNPRQNIEEFTKYSFPSKIMEYLATGKPVVAYKLDGMPDEYDNYIIFVPENSIEALTKTIYNVCTQPHEKLNAFGASAQHWVVTEKNGITQTKKIIEMIRSINRMNNVE